MFRFSTPARQNDFPHGPGAFEALCTQWNTNLTGFTLHAITGDPWNSTNAAGQTWHYNPATTGIPPGTSAVLVSWTTFPAPVDAISLPIRSITISAYRKPYA
jgi:hypothetical protein